MFPLRWISLPVLTVVLTACSSSLTGLGAPTATPSAGPPVATTTVPVSSGTGGSYPTRCQARDHNELPDPRCSPGATNPAVTQATVGRTICRSGYTARIRPAESVTEAIKRRAIRAYGDYAGPRLGSYELDHLISLELGGAPSDVRNLWPEKGEHNAKDPVENAAKKAVCSGHMSLAAAQQEIATNWIALGHQLNVPGIPSS
ncbi:MAG: hypothetical protein ACQSGP_22620 [Frankia sp.]